MSSFVNTVVKKVKAVGSAVLSGSSPGQEFQAVCEEADKFLEALSEKLKLPQNEIAATREQLQNKEILISAFGRHNAGKSTLLNALLHNELLPMNLRNETGIRVNIRHDSEMHKGPCGNSCRAGKRLLEEIKHGKQEDEYCPQLHTEGQSSCGSGSVYKKLKEANMNAKTSRGLTGPTHYTIVGNVPALANAPQGWRVMMTDNPGFGEAHQEYITQLAETSLKTSTAYLYVVDVGQLQDKVDAHSFELLHAKDEDVFSNKRVVIAVTQFDKTFSPVEHNQMSEEDAKGIVCDMIESSTGVKASQDLVVPVCSLWAFVARKFRHSQGDNNLRHYTVSELGKCPRGQQEIPERLKPAILANRLEAKSGIDILEERIRGMTGACAEIWAIAMTKNYCSYLGGAMEGVEKLLDSTRKTFQERSTNLKHLLEQYEFIEHSRNELIQSKEAGSAVYQELLQKSQKDVKGLKASLSQKTDEFAKMCKEKIENGEETFGPEEFKKDLETFREEVTTELQKAADAKCVFKETCAAHRARVEDIGKVFTQITSRAQKLLAAVEVHMYNATTDKGMTDFSEFFQDRKISPTVLTAKVPIPELTLTHIETIVCFMRQTFSWLFGPPKYSYKSHECLSVSMKQLRLRVKIAAKNYLADIERHAANHFFEGYCKVVNRVLQAFEGDFQKITKLKEEEEAIVKSLEEDVKKYEYWRQQIEELQSRLEQKRKKYCFSLKHQFDHGGMD